ncbi:MAG: DMT family transporter [Anaerolineae bacterium]
MSARYRGTLWLLVSATAYGSLVVLIKWAVAAGLTGATAFALRFTLAGLIWWLIPLVRGRPLWPGLRRAGQAAALGGLLYGPNALAYYQGTSLVSGTVAAMAIAAVPVVVALFARLLLGERTGRVVWLAVFLVVLGSVLMAGGPEGEVDPRGLLWLAVSVLLYSLYIVLSSPVTRDLSSAVSTVYVVNGGAAFYWIWGVLTGQLDFSFDPQGWWVVVALALLPTVLAMFALLEGIKIIGATRAAIVNGLEPVVGAILAVLFLGDRPGLLQIVGGGLTILAAILVQRERTQVDEPS